MPEDVGVDMLAAALAAYDARWAAFVHFLPPSEHDLIWRADGPFAPVTPGPHYTAAKPRYPFCDGKENA